jgi:DNA-binding transcriptional regulator YhcF (GntR family)
MKQTLFKKIAEQICLDYQSTEKLPSERALAQHYACTRRTIRTALQELQSRNCLVSDARKGHRLVQSQRKVVETRNLPWNIVMLLANKQLQDQNFLDLIGGAISAAAKHKINLIIREFPNHSTWPKTVSPKQLHEGIEADAYFLTYAPEPMRDFLENQFKPCVVLGIHEVVEEIENRRFIEVHIPQLEKAFMVLEKLLALGHRRYLYVDFPLDVAKLEDFALSKGYKGCMFKNVRLPHTPDSSAVRAGTLKTVLQALNDQTAMIIHAGGATHYNIFYQLVKTGIDIPRRLSMVLDSGRFDWLTSVCNVATVFSSAAGEGKACIDELATQLESGSLRFGGRFSSYQFLPNETIGAAMSSKKVKKYDQENFWKKDLV